MRVVNRTIIDEWVTENGPDGIARLAVRSGISSSMISKVRVGRVPTKRNTRRDIALAIGVTEEQLFPVLPDGEEKAS